MTASRIPTRRTSFTSPVVDYEPAPIGLPVPAPPCQIPPPTQCQIPPPTPCQIPPPTPCQIPSPAALHRHTARPLRPVPTAAPCTHEPVVPRAAAVFADTALRRILEVADRRRPAVQLRPLLVPALLDAVTTLIRAAATQHGAAVLRRVRLQPSTIVDGEATAAEVFATYTRGPRVRAIAGRIELIGGRWVIVALQIG